MIPDDVYVHQTVEGDAEAFNELVNRHHSKIYGLAYRMLGNPDDAADATQETFLEAYKSVKNVPISVAVRNLASIVSVSTHASSISVNRNQTIGSWPLTPEMRKSVILLLRTIPLNARRFKPSRMRSFKMRLVSCRQSNARLSRSITCNTSSIGKLRRY